MASHTSLTRQTEVLLVGPTGFLGSHIHAALKRSTTVRTRLLTRQPRRVAPDGKTTVYSGDLGDPLSLNTAAEGCDVVINAASYVGRDADLAAEVNGAGTRNLIEACSRASARLIQLSTTAVYGSGPHRGIVEDAVGIRPESPASASRARAEEAVLSASGSVVRPNFVYGAGDKWFIPGLAEMIRWSGGGLEAMRPRHSLIDAGTLGSLVASLALAEGIESRVFHAADPQPVELTHLLNIIESKVLALPGRRPAGDRAAESGRAKRFSPHQITMVAEDHWYDSSAIWETTGLRPAGLIIDQPMIAQWYAERLAAA